MSEVESFTLDSDLITRWLRIAGKYLAVIMFPFALLGSYVKRIIQALIYAAIGLLFALLCKVSLAYDALLRLAIVAMTPCIIIKTVLGLAGVRFPFAWLLYILVTLAYLYFGVKTCSQTPLTEQEIRNPDQMQI